jgi:hypothetical protein
MRKINFKSKKLWIFIVIVIGVIISFFTFSDEEQIKYETVKVERGDLIQTVYIIGEEQGLKNVF